MDPAPDPDLLRRFLDGELESDESAAVERHIDEDPAWQTALEEASGLPGFTSEFLQPVSRAPNPDRSDAVLNLIDRLKQSPPEGPDEELWKEILTPPPDSGPPGILGTLGDYEVLELLATGGMGVVFRARDPALDRSVALKALSPRLASNETARQRFLREARAAASLEHENILPIYGVHEGNIDEAVPWFAMRYIDGGSLEDLLQARNGPLAIGELVPLARQLAGALHAAHSQGIIHRDLKPSNILLEHGSGHTDLDGTEPPGRGAIREIEAGNTTAFLTDFGLARATDDPSLTYPGFVAGTPQYMAPEQVAGQDVDHRADLFGLGAILYHCATGKPPFGGKTSAAVMREVAATDPEIPARFRAQLPVWFVRMIRNLLAKDPAHRFQSAAAVIHSIDRRRAPRSVRQRRRLLAVGAAALTLLAAWGLLQIGPVAHAVNGVMASDQRPFLNTRRLGVDETLSAAVARARPGDTIEIKTNARLRIDDSTVIPPGRPLTIRAAKGFLPFVEITAAEVATISTSSDLRLERLSLNRDREVSFEPLLNVAGDATVVLDHCKLTIEGSPRAFMKPRVIVTAPGTTLAIKDSLVMVGWTSTILVRDESGSADPATIILDNSHLTGHPVIGFDCDDRNSVAITITRSALSGPSLFTDTPFRSLPTVRVESRESIFSSNGALWWIPAEPLASFTGRVRWSASASLFDQDVAFVQRSRNPDKLGEAATVPELADWQRLPGVNSESPALAPLWSGMKKKLHLPADPFDLGWEHLEEVFVRFLADFPGIGPDASRIGPDGL